MEMKLKKVRFEGKVVTEIEVPVFESLEEALESRGAETCLDYVNRYAAISDMNAARDKFRPVTAGKGTKYFLKALAVVSTEELGQFAGDEEKINEFLNSDEVRARVEEKLKSEGKALIDEDQEEESEAAAEAE